MRRFGDADLAEESVQEAFGRALGRLGRLPAAEHIVTLSADVAVTTHLAGWINRKGVWAPSARTDFFAETPQAMQWKESPAGQHIELGIAENNLFLMLAALGLSGDQNNTTFNGLGSGVSSLPPDAQVRLVLTDGLAREGVVPGGSKANLQFVAPRATFPERMEEPDRLVLADAQTAGRGRQGRP